LQARCEQPGRGIQLIEVAGGWQFRTREEYFPWVQGVARVEREERISPAAIETLAVVAYKQPATRAEIDAIRGAASANHLRSLMDRGLVRVTGRADVPGAPFQYGTTRQFLKHFGLESVKDLPDPKDLQRLLMEQGRGGAPEQA
jgi:segregation and condensation protein B